MENADSADTRPDPISIGRCRELLGDEAAALSDQDVGQIQQHADAIAHLLVEIFLDNRTTPE